MPDLNIADIWDEVADLQPDHEALVHGTRRVTWRQFEQRAGGLAAFLAAREVQRDDKVALYVYNDPAYLETVYACLKTSLVPVNTNYRYTDDELVQLWTDADAVAVVFHGAFGDVVDRIRSRLPDVRTWIIVDDGGGTCPPWATSFEAAVASSPRPATGRSGRDLLFIYTGGTTGMPKGVMWEQDTLVRLLLSDTAPIDDAATAPGLAARSQAARPGPCVVACPLMHGTGLMIAIAQLLEGGAVITLPDRTFEPEHVLDVIEGERAERLAIVGDVFARPILTALDAHPSRWDLSSLAVIGSSGTMWSEPVKQGLLRHHPALVLLDLLGSSEALGMATGVSIAGATASTARFAGNELTIVVDEAGVPVEPGSGQVGRLGTRGLVPVGYYRDPERSAATFPVIDGVRYAFPGDWATVDADGAVNLLGRGSVCINTGGEKVFPEEVERR